MSLNYKYIYYISGMIWIEPVIIIFNVILFAENKIQYLFHEGANHP